MSDLPPVSREDLDRARAALGLPPLGPAAPDPWDALARQMDQLRPRRRWAGTHAQADNLLVLLVLRLAEAHPREPQILAIVTTYQEVTDQC